MLGENPFLMNTPDFFMAAMSGSLPSCQETSCRLQGQSCKGNILRLSGPLCTHDCCAIGTRCVDNVCQTNNIGASCSADNDCYMVTSFGKCINKKCYSVSYPGDKCISGQCIDNTTCNTTGYCVGVATGSSCQNSLECQFGDFCNTDLTNPVCEPLRVLGENCTHSSECQYKFTCWEGACHPILSRKIGETCVPNLGHFWDQDCQVGLECYSGNNTCILPPVTFAQPCSKNETCGGTYSCVCNSWTGENICSTNFLPITQCESKLTFVSECIEQNQCKSTFGHWVPGTCEYDKCSAPTQAAVECLCPTIYKVTGNCLALPFNSAKSCAVYVHTGLSGGQVAGIVIGVLLGVVVIFVLLFWIQSKRSASGPTYESLQ